MSAFEVIQAALGKSKGALAHKVFDALDAAGYLIEPNGPLLIELDSRAVTHETELADGITLFWNSDTVVGIQIRDGFDVRSA